ncbi:11471_t:CDS:2 [Acaulospora colombiana]|uniref:11471_t:CDS:1 n=1 Tax=Acaulospora colombiana TaxID=27376 RepID=A0ACA9N298_9GLOM|nr:11471_t:CDS:2 [Acaulospora colombiana]
MGSTGRNVVALATRDLIKWNNYDLKFDKHPSISAEAWGYLFELRTMRTKILIEEILKIQESTQEQLKSAFCKIHKQVYPRDWPLDVLQIVVERPSWKEIQSILEDHSSSASLGNNLSACSYPQLSLHVPHDKIEISALDGNAWVAASGPDRVAELKFRHTLLLDHFSGNGESPNQSSILQYAKELQKYSHMFPEGYGDFALKSADGVIFHFPRYLLAHASSIFKDMFEIGDQTPSEGALPLTEDSNMLEALLLFIDPAKEARPPTWWAVDKFINTAEKYQVKGVIKWFEQEVEKERSQHGELTSPMVCLALATQYGLKKVTQYALQDLVKAHIRDIKHHPGVDSRYMVHLMQLRTDRTCRLIGGIFEIEIEMKKAKKRNCQIHPDEPDDLLDFARQRVIYHPNWKRLVEDVNEIIIDSIREGCICSKFDILDEIDEEMMQLDSDLPRLP